MFKFQTFPFPLYSILIIAKIIEKYADEGTLDLIPLSCQPTIILLTQVYSTILLNYTQ